MGGKLGRAVLRSPSAAATRCSSASTPPASRTTTRRRTGALPAADRGLRARYAGAQFQCTAASASDRSPTTARTCPARCAVQTVLQPAGGGLPQSSDGRQRRDCRSAACRTTMTWSTKPSVRASRATTLIPNHEKRLGFTGSVQWQPDDETLFTLDVLGVGFRGRASGRISRGELPQPEQAPVRTRRRPARPRCSPIRWAAAASIS